MNEFAVLCASSSVSGGYGPETLKREEHRPQWGLGVPRPHCGPWDSLWSLGSRFGPWAALCVPEHIVVLGSPGVSQAPIMAPIMSLGPITMEEEGPNRCWDSKQIP